MRSLLVIPLLLAACSGSSSDDTLTVRLTEPEFRRVRVIVLFGSVTVRTDFGVTGVALCAQGRKRGKTAEIDYGIEDGWLKVEADVLDEEWLVDVNVTVRPGLELVVVTRDAPVRIEGSWSAVTVQTRNGDVTVDADAIQGGRVKSDSGNLVVTSRTAPTRDLSCQSTGDVTLAVGAAFEGTVQVAGKELDVASHPRLYEKWGEERRSLTGYVGKKPSLAERQKQLTNQAKPPPGVWAVAFKGKATFRLLD